MLAVLSMVPAVVVEWGGGGDSFCGGDGEGGAAFWLVLFRL